MCTKPLGECFAECAECVKVMMFGGVSVSVA